MKPFRLMLLLCVLVSSVLRAEALELPEQLSLEAALELALAHNPTIEQAREQVRWEQGRLIEVNSAQLPDVQLSGNYYQQDSDFIFGSGKDEDWTASVNFRQSLYGGGGVRPALRAQRSFKSASLHALQAAVDGTFYDVRTRFYEVLLARDTIGVQEQNVALLEEQLKVVANRRKAGTVSEFELLQARVELANAKPALIRARSDYRVAQQSLLEAMGIARGETAVLGQLEYHPFNYELVDALDRALEKRPELLRLEQEAEATRERIRVEKAGYYPNVDLVGRYDYRRSFISSGRFEDPDRSWVFGVEASWDVFDGWATRGQVAMAKSVQRQAGLALREAQLAVEVEVRRAASSLKEARELVEAAELVVEQAEEALRLAQNRYDAGAATWLDLVQARVGLTQARNNQLQARYAHLVAVASLRLAIGETEVEVEEPEGETVPSIFGL